MDDTATFFGIFGEHHGRSSTGARLRIRDDLFVAELKARMSDLAARDNGTRNGGWLIDFSPTRHDDLTERSMFHATLTSERHGTRRIGFTIGRDWVEIGDGAMESSVRHNPRNLQKALENAFRRVVLRWPYGTVDPDQVRPVGSA